PKRSKAARWLKLYSGPRYATFRTFWRARAPLMISRYTARMVVSSSGPLLAWIMFWKTSSSRAGEKTSAPWSSLTLPIWAARAALSLTIFRIWRSSLSIWFRRLLIWAAVLGWSSFFLAMEGLADGVHAWVAAEKGAISHILDSF